jgi:hypothetical protein
MKMCNSWCQCFLFRHTECNGGQECPPPFRMFDDDLDTDVFSEREELIRFAHPFGASSLCSSSKLPAEVFGTLLSGSNPSQNAKTPLLRGFFAEREGLIRCAHPLPGASSLRSSSKLPAEVFGTLCRIRTPPRLDMVYQKRKKLPVIRKLFLWAEREGLIRFAHPLPGATSLPLLV